MSRRGWALVVYALVLRFAWLGRASLGVDEGMSWYVSHFWRNVEQIDVHPPLYYALLRAWWTVDASEAWMRAFSCLCSLVALGLFARLRPGWGALFLYAGLTYNLQYAREVRMYPLLGLWVLLGIVCFRSWCERRSRLGLAGYTLALSGGLWTHFFGVWTAPVAACLCRSRRDWLAWLGASCVGGATFVPWLARIPLGSQDLTLRGKPGWLDLFELVGRICVGDFVAGGAPLLIAIGLVALVLALWQRGDRLWLFWALVPPVATWAVSRFTPLAIFEFKYLVWTVPAWCVLLRRAAPFLLVANALTFGWLLFHPEGASQDWRWAASVVRAGRQPGDRVVVHPGMMAAPLLYYGFAPEEMAPVDQGVPLQGRVWLVSTPYHPLVQRVALETDWSRQGRLLASEQTESWLPSAVVRVSLWQGGDGAKENGVAPR